ncbi:hypothetical protein OUZ56_021604 [Daphnia magna]|uniref:Uncharacterized protein n=1 Tax=Daphnia magna TaxID=35525 RepID=A0ABR0ATY7_9CRUS|nr:hypothetical protein OUZ56_021604 [Daphnia magna]
MTGSAPFDALAHADSGSMNVSASNVTNDHETVSLDAARRARSEGEGPAVIGYTVRPQTIFKARKMMMGLYLPILGIRRQKRSPAERCVGSRKFFDSCNRVIALYPVVPDEKPCKSSFRAIRVHVQKLFTVKHGDSALKFQRKKARFPEFYKRARIVNFRGINPGQDVHSTIPSCKLNVEL